MKLDNNNYLHPNLFGTEDGFCYECQDYMDTVRHEPLNGPCREKSKRLGLWVTLCPTHHIRLHKNRQMELRYKQEAQRLYQEQYGDDFLQVFGRNYL